MNLSKLQRGIEHLAVLLEIRADKSERKREEELRLRLLAILALLLANEDYNDFRYAFLAALRRYYELLDVNGEYGQLIDREIAVQNGYLSGFIQDLKNDELSDAEARARAQSYARSLGKVKEQMNLYDYPDDARLRWTLGESEHCKTCLELNGRVETAQGWRHLGYYPKCSLTECDGSCQCFWTEA